MPVEPFFIVVTDRDRGTFNVLGPMTDDTEINHAVVQCQLQQRQVNCQTAGRGQSREQVIESCQRLFKLRHTDDPITEVR